MINLKSFSTLTQTEFSLPLNLFTPSPSPSPSPSPHLSFSFHKISLIPIQKTHNPLLNAAPVDGVYTPEETLYDLLGVTQSSTHSEIKQAYKQLVLKYHPDVAPPGRVNEYTMRFIRVKEAYETLSDPESRAIYDINLAKGLNVAFSVKKGSASRFEARSEWKPKWEVQVEELKRRSMVDRGRGGQGGSVSWAARVRKQRAASDLDQ